VIILSDSFDYEGLRANTQSVDPIECNARNGTETKVNIKKLIILMCFSTSGLLGTAQAAQQWCTGTIKAVYAMVDGSLYINGSYRNQWTQICNLMAVWKGVDPGMCKQWYAMSMTLRVTGEPAVVYYYDAPTCDAIPYYSDAPAPGYIMINAR